jgi:tRNA (cmo5U34)-methyltransferase
MKTPLDRKSSTEDIRRRFDADVERFSNMQTGQQATIDAPLAMELITRAALSVTHPVRRVLDIGCGAGNNMLKLLQFVNPLDCDLVDLSRPMLERACERVGRVNRGRTLTLQGDFRTLDLPAAGYDMIVAAAVLHHLRDERDWENAFRKIFNLTAPGGSVWITDLVSHEMGGVQDLMWERYGSYLETLGGPDYRSKVFDYIDREDSPRPVTYQLDLLRRVGFAEVDLLHKNSCFAAFGGKKGYS